MDGEEVADRAVGAVGVGVAGGAIVGVLLTIGFAVFWPDAPHSVMNWTYGLLGSPFVTCALAGLVLLIYSEGGMRACVIAGGLLFAVACVLLLPLGLHQAALQRWSVWEAVSGWGDWGTLLAAFFCGWYLGHDSRRRNRGEEQQP